MTKKKTTCADHTPAPDGYCAWHDWAMKMGKTHRQIRCDRCGLFKIWIPKHLSNRAAKKKP